MDPITLEVLRNAMQSVAEEMGLALIRTALSPNIKERRVCSAAIYNPEGQLVARAENIPLHPGLVPNVVKTVLKKFPPREMQPGDAVIINDPYISGSHLPDICVISPVFFKGRPLALAANLAHHADIGGSVPGSMSTTTTEIFQEGIRIPPVKISSRGVINNELLEVLAHNVRTPAEFYGDIYGQLSANGVGERRIQELADKYGPAKIQEYMEEIIKYSERRLRSGLAELPQGTFTFEDYLEGDGLTEKPVNIKVTLTTHGESLTVDFTGTHPQVPGPFNTTREVTLSCVYFAVKSVVDPGVPSNDGLTRPINVITPPNSLVDPGFPAPVAHSSNNTAQRVTDTILGALAGAAPERVTAAGTGGMNSFTAGGLNPESRRYYSYVETYGGGQGAKCDRDGMDGIQVNLTNARNTPVEVIELSYPLLVEEYGLLPDSGGPGEFRGGNGIHRSITILKGRAAVSVSTGRSLLQPWGLGGGRPGSPARLMVRKKNKQVNPDPGDNPEIIRGGKYTGTLDEGDNIVLETAGGGGFGDPLERNPEAVRRDVVEGLVSLNNAESLYGVVLTGDNMQVDYHATCRKRQSMKR